MSLHNITAPQLNDGELVNEAVLNAQEMAWMNAARENFDQLDVFIRKVLIPAIGGCRTELGEQLEAKVMNVRVLTHNFCWNHRHLGQMHDAREVRS
ncbi:hypothetical protein ACRS3X_03580 [Ectopseudomonas hydrolytica]|uniref:hypothetical protein n=1 Tax=Ectopseudomonas hydrolytica TaxID=2493633 RepID=UPI003EE04C51